MRSWGGENNTLYSETKKDGDFDGYDKKVSDAAKQIDKRLAELNRPEEEQSPKSNLVGNSSGRYAPNRNTSSVVGGDDTASRALSATPIAKVNKKLNPANDLVRKMAYCCW